MVTCEYCNKEFNSITILKTHQNSKFCIKNKVIYNCATCNYTTNDKTKYNVHMNKKKPCKKEDTNNNKLEKLIEKQNEKIDILEKQIKKTRVMNNYNYIIANYKDALNIEDCINSNNISADMLERCKKLSLKNGAIYILDSLCNIDADKRPIHCTDMSRLKYIVKSEDKWSIDNNAEKIKSNMSPAIMEVYKEVYKDLMKNSVTQDEKLAIMTKMCSDLLDINVEKSCINAIKSTVGNYSIKNINGNMLIEEVI